MTRTPLRPSLRRAAAVAAALSLGLLTSGCGVTGGGQASSSSPSAASELPSTDPRLAKFTGQTVTWTPCEQDRECADITVPVDYAAPDGETTTIRAIRIRSTKENAPSLFVNPGGPGGSGYDLVKDDTSKFTGSAIRGAYSVVGFDPRGVGKSDGIRCLTDEQKDAQREKVVDPSTAEGLAQAHRDAKALGEACVKNSGPVLAHMDTVSVARDLDVMRAAMGNAKLHYLGYSYGTALGSVYAQLFPSHVGRFVLDGAVAPNLREAEAVQDQAVAFEKSFSAYAAACLRSSRCPFTGTPESVKAELHGLVTKYSKESVKTSDGRSFTANDLANALILPMYSPEAWGYLTDGLSSLVKDENADTLMRLADIALDRDANGHYTSNSNEAFTAVSCLDEPSSATDAEMTAHAEKLKKAAPLVGEMVAYSQVSCVEWPIKPASGAPELTFPTKISALVIGTTGDPATPYDWAKKLTSALGPDSRLLTFEGYGHTAYGRGSACVDRRVQDYLVKGTLPEAGTVCRSAST